MRLLLALVLVLSACRPAAQTDEVADTPTTPSSATVAAPEARAVPLEEVDLVKASADEILAYIANSPAQVKVVNFWATWCVPCREEFPELVRLREDLRDAGVEVIFVSADFLEEESSARVFLAEQGAGGRSFLKNEKDDPFISAFDAEWSGELPTTILYGPDDRKQAVLTEVVTYATLKARIDALLTS